MNVLPQSETRRADERYMRRCLDLARTTPPRDVPIAAMVVAPDGRELAAATNRREADDDPLAHAEVLALRAAAPALGEGWRLVDCTLYVTLEPCTMCAGAAVSSRIGAIVFGAWEPKTGACGSLWDVVRDQRVPHRVAVRSGVCEDECAELVQEFLRGHR